MKTSLITSYLLEELDEFPDDAPLPEPMEKWEYYFEHLASPEQQCRSALKSEKVEDGYCISAQVRDPSATKAEPLTLALWVCTVPDDDYDVVTYYELKLGQCEDFVYSTSWEHEELSKHASRLIHAFDLACASMYQELTFKRYTDSNAKLNKLVDRAERTFYHSLE